MMQLVEMFLQKAFPTRKCNVGVLIMTHKMHIEETNEYFDTICGIYQCYLVLFNCQYHSHVEDVHILMVTNNDLLTNVNNLINIKGCNVFKKRIQTQNYEEVKLKSYLQLELIFKTY